jgi:hypothetical protein
MRRHVITTLLIGALAASLAGCGKDATSPTSPMDMSPPAAPGNLQASTDPATGSDWLDWDPSASVNVAHYEVYVSDSPGGAETLVAAVNASASDYLLPPTTETVTEYYRVRAVGTNDVPSAFSSTVSVDRDGWPGQQPPAGRDKNTEDPN